MNSNVCLKCGCIKVEGTHHCGACGRCVYKMDHHCPWTDNCVGYYTIKQFLLFLFYVTCLTFVTVFWMYQAAWDQNIRHVSLLNFWTSSNLRHLLILKFAPEEERKRVVQENKETFEMMKKLEGDPDDIFSF